MNPIRIVASLLNSRRLMTRFRTREQLDAWHDERVMRHMRWVRSSSVYYRDLFHDRDERDWRHFPVSDKRVMVEDFDRANTAGLKRDELLPLASAAERSRDFSDKFRGYSIGLSSGTTGRRSLFVSSSRENDRWAGAVLARVLRRPVRSCRRIAFFHRANNTLYSHANVGVVQLRFFDLLRPLSDLLGDANEYQPTMLVGPPAMLSALADAQRRGAIRIAPTRIISVAEQLDPLDQARVENAFSLKLDQLYVATEGFLAATCPHGALHLCEDLIVVQEEPVPGDPDRYIPVLTDFTRRTEPVIRLRLNDILVRGGACPCGSIFRTLKRIEGRCDDQFVFRHRSTGAPVFVFPDFIRSAATYDPTVEAFHVVQVAPERIVVQLKTPVDSPRSAHDTVRQAFERLFNQLDVEPPSIDIADYRVDFAKGKLRRVHRDFALPDYWVAASS